MLGIYIVYCFYWGLKGYFTEKTSSGYAIAGRSIPFFAFLLAATAASFSGWTFIGHPGLIWRDGLAYAFASFYVLTIPITGTFFPNAPGCWANATASSPRATCTPTTTTMSRALSGRAHGRSVLHFYSAVQLMASARCSTLSPACRSPSVPSFMAFIVWFYVCTGGLKASTWVGVIQFVLLVGGIIILGFTCWRPPEFGGWSNFSRCGQRAG
jgi:SSS family solute:Na+ symporter